MKQTGPNEYISQNFSSKYIFFCFIKFCIIFFFKKTNWLQTGGMTPLPFTDMSSTIRFVYAFPKNLQAIKTKCSVSVHCTTTRFIIPYRFPLYVYTEEW